MVLIMCNILIFATNLDKQKKSQCKIVIFLPLILAYVLGAEKNCLIETVLLSTYKMFWLRNKINFFCYTLLAKGLFLSI